ncbi:MAG: tRNA (adenosine(37)-N6)-threonylcarbamoyltransferase complex ATPase subunit type 1 TsaE [Ruminococcaceae bacterium]|nr:tRNA (adenosine(37)-N6)-threonylcarbamoyltransferase complex ATPase subunit type 1 TsaE [Oscillospiraceae bacterium]
MQYITKSYDETHNLGVEFASKLKEGTLIALDGDLGAGKTAFTTGVASGFGVTETVTSPTFTIVNEYRSGRIPVFHFDVYRLSSMDDLYDIGWDDYVAQNGIILMEWASIVKDDLDYPYYEINITKRLDLGDDVREISIEYRGEKL